MPPRVTKTGSMPTFFAQILDPIWISPQKGHFMPFYLEPVLLSLSRAGSRPEEQAGGEGECALQPAPLPLPARHRTDVEPAEVEGSRWVFSAWCSPRSSSSCHQELSLALTFLRKFLSLLTFCSASQAMCCLK